MKRHDAGDILERASDLQRALRSAKGRSATFTCDEQRDLALAFLHGDPTNVLGIMPTGKGKSLCFQLPTWMWSQEGPALTVVVAPILALMQDQVNAIAHYKALGSLDIAAEQLNSTVPIEKRRAIRRRVARGEINLLYLGPEVLVQPWTYELLADAARNRILRGLVIDEAHMITAWGDDFRTAFKRMGPVRRCLQEACPEDMPLRTLILTATLPAEQRPEVLRAIGCETEIHTIERKEIRKEHFLSVREFPNREKKLAALYPEVRQLVRRGSGIVYCNTRRDCEEIAAEIEDRGLAKSRYFHGGTPGDQRELILEGFRRNRLQVVVATNAFGLGVDKPDVRWVLHFSMPSSIDRYYQEIGRGGRDGKRCEAILYYSGSDKALGTKNALKTLSTEKFDDRLRSMRKEGIHVGRAEGPLLLVEEETLPQYVLAAGGDIGEKAKALHAEWNYAVLVRAEQLEWLRLHPDVVVQVACTLAPRADLARAKRSAPTLARLGLLSGMAPGRVRRLDLAAAAHTTKTDPLLLQRELFDLLLGGQIKLAEGEQRHWNTRVLVEDLIGRHTKRLPQAHDLRLAKSSADVKLVEAMAAYVKTRGCRRKAFYEAYGYQDLIERGGCGRCDRCASRS